MTSTTTTTILMAGLKKLFFPKSVTSEIPVLRSEPVPLPPEAARIVDAIDEILGGDDRPSSPEAFAKTLYHQHGIQVFYYLHPTERHICGITFFHRGTKVTGKSIGYAYTRLRKLFRWEGIQS